LIEDPVEVVEPSGSTFAKIVSPVFKSFALVALLLVVVVGDTQANTAEESASVSASAVPADTLAQTATNATHSASDNTDPIPKVAKTPPPVKSNVKSSESFKAYVVKAIQPETAAAAVSGDAAEKTTTKSSAEPSSKPSSSSKPKVQSTPKKESAKPAEASTGSTRGLRALAFAKAQIGEPYVTNADGPNGWDCSGLTMKAWAAAGVKGLPHSAHKQLSHGKRVSKANLRKGDLVFFYSPIHHVGIYAGNGEVIHASRPGKPVGYIKMKYMPYAGAVRPG
jgi:cell wall-associated NlpC family hydrolase